jgi:hypothetical protein
VSGDPDFEAVSRCAATVLNIPPASVSANTARETM